MNRDIRSSAACSTDIKGVALIEFAVALPFLVLMVLSVADVSLAINNYLKLNWITYEGARYASRVPALEVAVVADDFPETINEYSYQAQVRRRIWDLLATQQLEIAEPMLTTELTREPSADDPGTDVHTVKIKIDAQYRGILASIPLRVSTSGPYLLLE